MSRQRASEGLGPKDQARFSSSSAHEHPQPPRRSPNDADPPLPQWLADIKRWLAPDGPPTAGGGRRAAVLIVLVEGGGDGPRVLLTQRSDGLRYLPGAVTFPGGAFELADRGPLDTALREAEEEIGLDPASVDVIGQLPDRTTPDDEFIVTPVIAWTRQVRVTAPPNPDEVVGFGLVRLAELAPLLADAGRPLVHLPASTSNPRRDTLAGAVAPITAALLGEIVTACHI